MKTKVHQRASHQRLLQDVSGVPAPPLVSRRGRLDAIVVPAARPASVLQPLIDLAALLDVLLVVFCSRQTQVERVAERVARTPRSRCLIVPVVEGWSDSRVPRRTAHQSFDAAKGGHASDLSLKRNLGLLLARLIGWNKIVFIDDDIRLSRPDYVGRLAGQLELNQAAGMVVPDFPDNSVVCHARRLAGLFQDNFVSGAVLGVHTNSLPLSFFPEIYNEDWFFFAREAAARKLPQVGAAVQEEYLPFATPARAEGEEFGDVLAEGLFALFDESPTHETLADQLRRATSSYWEGFIEARHRVIVETRTRLDTNAEQHLSHLEIMGAVDSLIAAEEILTHDITPALCSDFVAAWQEDLQEWGWTTTKTNKVGGTRAAMDALGLSGWRLAEFGCSDVQDLRGSQRIKELTLA